MQIPAVSRMWCGRGLSAIVREPDATTGVFDMPVPSPETVNAVLQHADAQLDKSRETLFDLLRIPSISAQEAHRDDCARAAAWVRDRLVTLGFRTEIRPT